MVGNARRKFAFLWFSQSVRLLADWALRMAAVAEWVALHKNEPAASAWYLTTVVFVTPWLLLAPLNGCLSNSLPRRWVLVGSAVLPLVAVVLLLPTPLPVMFCLGAVAVGSAVYGATRYAMIPGAAMDTEVSLPRLNSLIDLGGSAAVLGGLLLGWNLGAREALFVVMLGLNLICLVSALPVSFPSDQPRPEAALAAVRGFFIDCGRIARQRDACAALLGLSMFGAIITAGGGVLLAPILKAGFAKSADMYPTLLLIGGAAALGCGAAGWQKHPARNKGLVAPAALTLLLSLAWVAVAFTPGGEAPWLPVFLLSFAGGIVTVALRSAYVSAVPADARGNAMSVMNATVYLVTFLLALLLYGLSATTVFAADWAQLAFLAILAALGTVLALVLLFRETLENIFDVVLWPIYRVRAYGPGVGHMPARGPLLVVANHSSYTDPIFVGKIVPQLIHPMMTSLFYDVPVVRWWLVHVFRVIRVEATTYRREAPELAEAVTMLKNGECVVVFPEAMLRRTQEQLLRAFGQGVWHILREVPDTPVVVLWIEGGYGTFFSYWNGPPCKNKRFDWWRRIRIGVSEVGPLPPSILVDHRTTRDYLRHTCLECRRFLGLDVPTEIKEKEAGTDPATVPS